MGQGEPGSVWNTALKRRNEGYNFFLFFDVQLNSVSQGSFAVEVSYCTVLAIET